VRYTPAGGRIDVRYRLQEDEATVEVADTGIGVAPESLGRIFEKFAREPEAERLEAHGLGLGLALVKQMAEAHDGRVEAAGAPGGGSTFSVTLPRLRPVGGD
jgi:signal transduction histidine kinase